ncbi:MAG: hypothetical protein A4E65_03453 [Syntrophorhabdus sp. PtaU1.Bin153]|nr:MAG: hypothetical protein A4E65_03453 [Syntrophorhabdus sp. PtaU1.Bin153]
MKQKLIQQRGMAMVVMFAGLFYLVASAAAFPLEQAKLIPSDQVVGGEFGRSIAIDESFVVVGAAGPALEGYPDSAGPGAAYVFARKGDTYVLDAKLSAPDPVAGAEFGRAVAIQGNTVVVGARFATTDGVERAGAVYIFRKIKSVWMFEAKVTSDNPTAEDNFGRALVLADNRLIVTARKEEAPVLDAGAAYVFEKRGGAWVQVARVVADNATIEARFGQSVAMNGDLMAVGARDADSPVATGCGAVYVFKKSGDDWLEVAKLAAHDGATGDQFAFNIAMERSLLVVGARRANLPAIPPGRVRTAAGAAYIFKRSGAGWTEIQKLTASDALAGDEFGHSVAMAGDMIAVGARRVTIDGKRRQGAIYLFRQQQGEWIQIGRLVAEDGGANDELGHSLAAHGSIIAAGANGADLDVTDAGAAYLFSRGIR